MEKTPTAVIIGAGNAAWHLAGALRGKARILTVCSRTSERAAEVAGRAGGCRHTDSLADIPVDADFYIIAVADDAISAVAAAMPAVTGVVAHTSGSVPASTLSGVACRGYGSFYPLQTMTRGRELDMSHVPFFIEGSDDATASALRGLASRISDSVHNADSGVRARLHLAAVVASNFGNALLAEAGRILADGQLPLSVLRPLMEETMAKAFDHGPLAAQTGPARRGDRAVMDRQQQALPPAVADIYRLMSNLIQDQQKCQK